MSARGFSLVELMLILAIISILAAFTAPNLPRWTASVKLNSSVREIASELQLARMKAIAQNTSISVCFYKPSPDFPQYPNGFFSTHYNNTEWCASPPVSGTQAFQQFALTVKGLPTGLHITPPIGNHFTFNSRGQVNSQHVDLTNPSAKTTKRITVHFTGRVRIDAL